MRVCLAAQKLSWRLAHALGTVAALQPSVVQVELQQRQIVRAQVPAEEKVGPQPTVEVFHQRTGPNRVLGQRGDGELNLVEPAPEVLAHGRFLGPAPWVALVARQRPEQAPWQFSGDLEVAPQLLQILIEPTGEGEEIVPLILQGAANRPQPIDALRRGPATLPPQSRRARSGRRGTARRQ